MLIYTVANPKRSHQGLWNPPRAKLLLVSKDFKFDFQFTVSPIFSLGLLKGKHTLESVTQSMQNWCVCGTSQCVLLLIAGLKISYRESSLTQTHTHAYTHTAKRAVSTGS